MLWIFLLIILSVYMAVATRQDKPVTTLWWTATVLLAIAFMMTSLR